MRFAILIFSLAFLLVLCAPAPGHAADKTSCEFEMLPSVRQIVGLVTRGLETQDLDSSDIEFMLSEPRQVLNPFQRKNRDVRNIAYKNTLGRKLLKLNPEEIAQARTSLENLIHENSSRTTAILGAKTDTRLIFAPKELNPMKSLNTTSKIGSAWVKGGNGQSLLAYWDRDAARIMTVNPRTREVVNAGSYRPARGDYLFSSRIENNHAISLIHRDRYSLIVIDRFADRKTGETYPLPYLLDRVHIVRSADGKLFAIAYSKQEVITYAVDDNLKLREVHRHLIKSDDFQLRNTENGRILAVTINHPKKEVQIFDPLSAKMPRKISLKREIMQVSSFTVPDGRHAVAIKASREKNGKRAQFFVATSDSTEILQTRPLENATSIQWVVAQNGEIYYVVKSDFIHEVTNGLGPARTIIDHDVELYQPFKPKLTYPSTPSRFLNIFRKSQPFFESTMMIRNPDLTGIPLVYETSDGRFNIIAGYEHSPNRWSVNIFDPTQNARSPIRSFNVDATVGGILHVLMEDSKEVGFKFFLVNGAIGSKIYLDSGNVIDTLSAPGVGFNELALDFDGHLYLSGEKPDFNSDELHSELKLYRLTSGGPGEQ